MENTANTSGTDNVHLVSQYYYFQQSQEENKEKEERRKE